MGCEQDQLGKNGLCMCDGNNCSRDNCSFGLWDNVDRPTWEEEYEHLDDSDYVDGFES